MSMKNKHFKILNSVNAFHWLGYRLREKYNVFFNVAEYNEGKHFLFYPLSSDDSTPRFYAIFKREFFMTFNHVFKDFVTINNQYNTVEYNTVGESINADWLEVAIRTSDFILFVYEGGAVYKVPPLLIKNFCEKHQLIRVQDKKNIINTKNGTGAITTIKERTYSFPVALLERFGDV